MGSHFSMRLTLFFFLISVGVLHATSHEEDILAKSRAYLALQDPKEALKLLQEQGTQAAHSPSFWKQYIRTLAQAGRSQEATELLFQYQQDEQVFDWDLAEQVAWGQVQEATHSSQLPCRLQALLAAHFSRKIEGVRLLLEGMRSSNILVRTLAIHLAAELQDRCLVEEVALLFRKEKNTKVRRELIRAIGKMKIVSLQPILESYIGREELADADRDIAVEAYISFLERPSHAELERFALSPRVGHRLLYCRLIVMLGLCEGSATLQLLAEDPHPSVRMHAFQALGILRLGGGEALSLVKRGIDDSHPLVAASAAYVLCIEKEPRGKEKLAELLQHAQPKVRWFTSFLVSAMGLEGEMLALRGAEESVDPYVRLNLSVALFSLRSQTGIGEKKAALLLHKALAEKQGRWKEETFGFFSGIVRERDAGEEVEAKDLLLELQLCSLLYQMDPLGAKRLLEQFLHQHAWGISGMATAVLLTEGEMAEISMVEDLLKSHDKEVQLQAAIVLAIWGKHESSLAYLKSAYKDASFSHKIRILEGMVQIGSFETLPFFFEVLQSSSETLRTLGAVGLIHTLQFGF